MGLFEQEAYNMIRVMLLIVSYEAHFAEVRAFRTCRTFVPRRGYWLQALIAVERSAFLSIRNSELVTAFLLTTRHWHASPWPALRYH